MKLTNGKIYTYYNNLIQSFMTENRQLPAKIYFYILKNQHILENIVHDIDHGKQYIINKYNIDFDGNGQLIATEEDEKMANQELDELSKIEQEINIYTFSFFDIENIEFTKDQMEAIMFMIEEN